MTSELKLRIQTDLIAARKNRDKPRTLVLSTALSEIRNREIDLGAEIDDEGVTRVLTRAIKQRRDASEQMRRGGRGDLADTEDAQAAVLGEYLPEGMSEDEVRAIVRELISTGVTRMGPLMGQVMPRIQGRFDGKEANRIVREALESEQR
ncbi:MAG: GatB/YqeY domain-containing protein [Gemmatimonadota bacterium]|nr:GatB/YqeY domain-containing protein [Gemmatimonadota bacterium]